MRDLKDSQLANGIPPLTTPLYYETYCIKHYNTITLYLLIFYPPLPPLPFFLLSPLSLFTNDLARQSRRRGKSQSKRPRSSLADQAESHYKLTIRSHYTILGTLLDTNLHGNRYS